MILHQNLEAQHSKASALKTHLALASRGWASLSAGQAPETEDRAPGRGGQASTKQRYLHNRRLAAGGQASTSMCYDRVLVWAARFPNWASQCPRQAPQLWRWAPWLRRWASGLAVFPKTKIRF
jgi:hypothetical protein